MSMNSDRKYRKSDYDGHEWDGLDVDGDSRLRQPVHQARLKTLPRGTSKTDNRRR